jgi:hypothetical protein
MPTGFLCPSLCQIDLDEIAHNAQLNHFAQVAALVHGHQAERTAHSLPFPPGM